MIAAKLRQDRGREHCDRQVPANPYLYNLKWDGAWQGRHETFCDIGLA